MSRKDPDSFSEIPFTSKLILTTNKKVTALLFQGEVPHKRTYLVQVEKHVTPERLLQLQTGIEIRIKGGEYYTTLPSDVTIVEKPKDLPKRGHAFREDLPHTWLLIKAVTNNYFSIFSTTYSLNGIMTLYAFYHQLVNNFITKVHF